MIRGGTRAGKSKLTKYPAIRHSIVESEPVSIVVTRSDTTERCEERAQLKCGTAWHTVFVEDPNSAAVHNLHVVVRTDCALCIRRRGIGHAHALEDEDRTRNVYLEQSDRSKRGLQGAVLLGRRVRVRLAVEDRVQLIFFFSFLLQFAIGLVGRGHELTHRARFNEPNRVPDHRDTALKLRVPGRRGLG